jgi:CheY-like chemotaxis protein
METSQYRCISCGEPLADPKTPCPRCSEAQTYILKSSAGVPATHSTHSTDPTDPADGKAPRRILEADSRYEILTQLGRGGMGIVYKVRDRETEEIIAIKVLDSQLTMGMDAVEQFKQEFRLARRINHPFVIRLYHFFQWKGQLAIAQEYIEGSPLSDMLTGKPFRPRDFVNFMRPMGSALTAAHGVGIIHRDLKPSNILMDKDGKPHILDFGVATLKTAFKNEKEKYIIGTPAYMAPEQAIPSRPVDHRADIYSLGVLLYQMATGALPFYHSDTAQILLDHVRRAPPRPTEINRTLPPVFEQVILRCLEKDPARRFDSALDIYRALEKAFAAVPPAPDTPPRRKPAGSGAPPSVMIVDDDEAIRRFVSLVLGRMGVRVREARNGHEGVDAAVKEQPDLIILDLNMPVLDGREALRILKWNPKTAQVPVVILTSVSDEEEAMYARDTGAAAYLNKPIQPDVLELLVEKYIPR